MSKEKKQRKIRSAAVLARLLGAEGFSDHLANRVESYWKTRSGLTDRQKASIKRLKTELSRIAAGLSEGDRHILGRFIGLHSKMNFDTGLKIGLQTFATKVDKEIEEIE